MYLYLLKPAPTDLVQYKMHKLIKPSPEGYAFLPKIKREGRGVWSDCSTDLSFIRIRIGKSFKHLDSWQVLLLTSLEKIVLLMAQCGKQYWNSAHEKGYVEKEN